MHNFFICIIFLKCVEYSLCKLAFLLFSQGRRVVRRFGKNMPSFTFSTVAEYDTQITALTAALSKNIGVEEFSLNTGQSMQKVKMSISDIRQLLKLYTGERAALIQASAGAGVTGLTFRRNY